MLVRIFLLVTLALPVWGQWKDTFDGNMLDSRWSGTRQHFTVLGGKLVSQGPSTSSGNLFLSASLPPNLPTYSWNLGLHLLFAPSSTNYFRWYLSSSSSQLNTSSIQGYYIQIGETNQDTLKFFRQNGTTRTKIWSASTVCFPSASANYGPVQLSVERERNGHWTFYADCAGGSSKTALGSVIDSTFSILGFTGFQCVYGTASRYNLFQLLDVAVQPMGYDDEPPSISSWEILDANRISVTFSESVDWSTVSVPGNLSISGVSIVSYVTKSPSTVELHILPALSSGEIRLLSQGIRDLAGNTMTPDDQSITYEVPTTTILEDWTDGNLFSNPKWTYNSTHWLLESNGLRSNVEVPNTLFGISTAFVPIHKNMEWESCWELGFNPSSANYIDWVLSGDQWPLTNGHLVRIGSSTDDVALYSVRNGQQSLLLKSPNQILNNPFNAICIKAVKKETTWELWFDGSGTKENYGFVGTTAVTSSLSGGFSGFYVRQSTSSFYKKHLNKLFYAGQWRPDTLAPRVVHVSVPEANKIEFTFHESLDTSVTPNFSILRGHQALVGQIRWKSNKHCLITFSPSLPVKTFVSFQLNQFKDLAGNLGQYIDSVIYVPPYIVQPFDIQFNEIYADETPSVGLPSVEYLELFNASEEYISLKNFKLNDGGTERTIVQDQKIPPGGYCLVVNGPQAAQSFYQWDSSLCVVTLSGLSLTNGGEPLTLFSPQGTVIDGVNYSIRWYKTSEKDDGGWSLEKIRQGSACSGYDQWMAAVATIGGTPGKVNSVQTIVPDTIRPKALEIKPIKDNIYEIQFSKPLKKETLVAANIQLNPTLSLKIDSIVPDLDRLWIRVENPLNEGVRYSLNFKNIQDCPGNALRNSSLPLGKGRTAKPYEILITEILPNESPSKGLPESEFVEIYNASNDVLALDSLYVCDASTCVPLENTTLYPKEYAVICPSSQKSAFQSFGKTIALSSLPSLNNAGDRMMLKHQRKGVIHFISYDYAMGYLPGQTLELTNLLDFCNPSAWKPSLSTVGGTPGQQNSIQLNIKDSLPPAILRSYMLNEQLAEIVFHERLDSNSLSLWNISSNHPSQEIRVVSVSGWNQSTVQLALSAPLLENQIFTLTLSGLQDCLQNTQTWETSLVQPGKNALGSLTINELLFNPNPGGVDFVEIKNISTNYINIKDWKLGRIYKDTLTDVKSISTIHKLLPPQSLWVITSDSAIIKNQYPKTPNGVFLPMSSLPSYNDDEGTVVLLMPNDTVADVFPYNEDMHFALIDDKEGVSLEKISPELPSQNRTSWQSAASEVGYATPGRENSQKTSLGSSNSYFSLPYAQFTPDQDGHKDFLVLNYTLPEHGHVANIRVYDAKGRQVKHLAKNNLLGKEGFLVWDGTTDDLTKAPIGVYLIHVSTFALNGSTQETVLRAALGGKLD